MTDFPKKAPISVGPKRRSDGTMPGQRFAPEVRAEMRRLVLECPHPPRSRERREYVAALARRFGADRLYVLSQAAEHRGVGR